MKAVTVTLIARDDQDLAEINREAEQFASNWPCVSWENRDTTPDEDAWLREEYEDDAEDEVSRDETEPTNGAGGEGLT